VLAQVPDWPTTARERLESVVGELVANAIEHGVPPVRVELVRARPGTGARLSVHDQGAGPVADGGRDDEPAERSERGRGHGIVRALGEVVSSSAGPEGYRIVVDMVSASGDGPQPPC
jgi:anti-sigma regulatory factor (Ser/Thr protein kinase)